MTDIIDALKVLVNPISLLAFLFLFVPGTISLRIYDRLRSRRGRKITESIVDVIIASFINDSIWIRIFNPIRSDVKQGVAPTANIGFEAVLAFVVSPIVLAIIYVGLENVLASVGLVSDADPRPWDKWFKTVKRENRNIGVVLVMKSDHRVIGGRFIKPGFASSAPAEESIHIGQTWQLEANTGRFVRPIAGSQGIFVQMSDVETIEFLEWSTIEQDLRGNDRGE